MEEKETDITFLLYLQSNKKRKEDNMTAFYGERFLKILVIGIIVLFVAIGDPLFVIFTGIIALLFRWLSGKW